jgi:hypothetical protein
MTNGGAVLSSDGTGPESKRPWLSDWSSMAQRDTCYMDSTPSIIAANTAAVDEAGDR